MQQLEFFNIPSPCIGVCQSGERGYCKGCFRSREERLHWNVLDAATKRTIIKACQRRKRRAGSVRVKLTQVNLQQSLWSELDDNDS